MFDLDEMCARGKTAGGRFVVSGGISAADTKNKRIVTKNPLTAIG